MPSCCATTLTRCIFSHFHLSSDLLSSYHKTWNVFWWPLKELFLSRKILSNVEVSCEPKNVADVVAEVVRSTKSILEASTKVDEIFVDESSSRRSVWIPKKSGSPSVPIVMTKLAAFFNMLQRISSTQRLQWSVKSRPSRSFPYT